jgi:hypothetical protein
MIVKTFISALVLVLGVLSLPAVGAESTHAVMTQGTTGHLVKAANFNSNDLKHMTLPQLASIVGGAIVGGSLTDMVVDGTVFTILGVVAGAVLGNEWYDRGMWPFK